MDLCRYEGYGPALRVGLQGIHTKAPASSSGQHYKKRFIWAAIEPGGHSPPPLPKYQPEVNGSPWQPAQDPNKVRARWAVQTMNGMIREKLLGKAVGASARTVTSRGLVKSCLQQARSDTI